MIKRANYFKTRKYLRHLAEVEHLVQTTLDRYRFYLRHLLIWMDDRDMARGRIEQVRPTFPTYLSSLSGTSGHSLAACTQRKILDTCRRFLTWARATYPHELSTLPENWIESLRPVRQPHRSAAEHIFVSEEDVHALLAVPAAGEDLALIRDQAAAAMLYLSGMRGGALVTLPILAVDLDNLSVRQWPELGVHTKNLKQATTFLLNIPEILTPVRRWDELIRPVLPPNTPWYAPIAHAWGDQHLAPLIPGRNRLQALHKRLGLLFKRAGLSFKSAHKFRHGHAVYGLLHAQTMSDYKAVSMNLMHESIEITDSTYAPMLSSDVQKRISGLTRLETNSPEGELEGILEKLRREDMAKAIIFLAGKLAS